MPQMPPTTYVPPDREKPAFHCPFCGVYAVQNGESLGYFSGSRFWIDTPSYMTTCAHCSKEAFWFNGRLIEPLGSFGPMPSPDTPDDVRRDYEEARAVAQVSPRSAAGLLRLALEKLLVGLVERPGTINQNIGALVADGLPVRVQRAADSLRVIGNEAVHPGAMDLRDDRETVEGLFGLLNFIVEDRITRPKAIDEFYALLPDDKIQGIENRDSPKL